MIPLQVKQVIDETPDTKSFVLSAGNDAGKIRILPGQFLTFLFNGIDGREERRNYSVSSTPVLNELLKITVKRVVNGAWSRKLLDEVKEGDWLNTSGASGYFVLPDRMQDWKQLVFFAAGSGITPVISIIKTALHLNNDVKIVLVYSNRSTDTTIFYNELLELQNKYESRFTVDFLFSSDSFYPRKRLNVGMIALYAASYSRSSLFYLCGPVEYMRTITIILRTEGIEENRIRKEIFHIEKQTPKEIPPDVLSHQITVLVDEDEYAFESQYPLTILQAAKKARVQIPYSCEAGQCGTCSASCISGKVWMWHNDVLLDDEIAKGRVLTCTGYAVGGDVILKF